MDDDLASYAVSTDQVERLTGLGLWDRLFREKIDKPEARAGKRCEYGPIARTFDIKRVLP